MREAAKLNGLPVDVVTEIPADIKAEPRGAVQQIATAITAFSSSAMARPACAATATQKYGVTLLTSYGTADKQASYWVYQAPNFSAVESAAQGQRRAVRVDRGDSGDPVSLLRCS